MKDFPLKFLEAIQTTVVGTLSMRIRDSMIRLGMGAMVFAGILAGEGQNSDAQAQGISCIVLGDSIAEGTLGAMRRCSGIAVRGITSTNFLDRHGNTTNWRADVVVISLGANDFHEPTQNNLERLRGRVYSPRVVWLVPNLPPNRSHVVRAIQNVAMKYGDPMVSVRDPQVLSSDGLHPTGRGYQIVARRIVNELQHRLAAQSYVPR
jgi:hypothetical protein